MLRISPLVSLKKKQQPRGSVLEEEESPPRKLIKLDDAPNAGIAGLDKHAVTATSAHAHDSEDELDTYIQSIHALSSAEDGGTSQSLGHSALAERARTDESSRGRNNHSNSDSDDGSDFIVSYLDYLEKHPIREAHGEDESDPGRPNGDASYYSSEEDGRDA